MTGHAALGQPDAFVEALECIENKEYIRAVKLLIGVLKSDPTYHPAYDTLGDVYLAQGQSSPAVENFAQAVAYDPDNPVYAQKLIHVVSALKFKKMNPNLKGVLTACLQSDDIQFLHFGRAWLSINNLNPFFVKYYAASKHKDYNVFKKKLDQIGSLDGLADVFFLSGIGRFIITDLQFERWIAFLRRYVLEGISHKKKLFSDEDHLVFLSCALSRYCFLTDYIFSVSAQEATLCDELKRKITSSKEINLAELTCLGCYQPLYTLDNAKEIAQALMGGDHVSQIPKAQIQDTLEQNALKASIPRFTDIEDDTSRVVQEQYEIFPYPRWKVSARDFFNVEIEGALKGKAAHVLIAGCGTGQEAVQMANVLSDAKIKAVDLSQTSLAYGIHQSEKLGVQNIEFGQGDINHLGCFDEKFDYIASAGVLHHMADPKVGWRVLTGLLADNGLMRIALYSRHARWAVNDARRIIAEKNIGSDADSIRAFRADVNDLLKYKSVQNISNFYDYYNLSECRDLLFHPCEHQYDLIEIKNILSEFGLEFLSFYLDHKVIEKYKRQNRHDKNATDLESWAKWEEKNPNTFSSMYIFWCRKT